MMERRRFIQTVGGGTLALGATTALGSAMTLREDDPPAQQSQQSQGSQAPNVASPPAGDVLAQTQFGLSGQRDFSEPAPSGAALKPSAFVSNVGAYKLRLADWNPNLGYPVSPSKAGNTTNRYTLFMPFESIGDQQDNEIMPLRVQWASAQRSSDIGPNSESWRMFQELYSYQFGEQKTVALFAPELSFEGNSSKSADRYYLGRYVRMTNLFVRPEHQPDYEKFVHTYIIPAAEKILTQLDVVMKATTNRGPLPPDKRAYWRLPAYLRVVAVNVNMPTIPEFEIFTQRHLVAAAQETNTPLLCYRTVSGTRHNYYFVYPFNEHKELPYSRDTLVASALLREHQMQIVAKRSGQKVRVIPAALGSQDPEIAKALQVSSELSEQFHSHAIELEEIVYRVRPDMSARLDEKFTKDSLQFVRASLQG
jgi:hypothetical protein